MGEDDRRLIDERVSELRQETKSKGLEFRVVKETATEVVYETRKPGSRHSWRRGWIVIDESDQYELTEWGVVKWTFVGSLIGSIIGWFIGHAVSGGDSTSRGNMQFTDEGVVFGFWASGLLAFIGALVATLVGYSSLGAEKNPIWWRGLLFVSAAAFGWGAGFLFIGFAAGNN